MQAVAGRFVHLRFRVTSDQQSRRLTYSKNVGWSNKSSAEQVIVHVIVKVTGSSYPKTALWLYKFWFCRALNKDWFKNKTTKFLQRCYTFLGVLFSLETYFNKIVQMPKRCRWNASVHWRKKYDEMFENSRWFIFELFSNFVSFVQN